MTSADLRIQVNGAGMQAGPVVIEDGDEIQFRALDKTGWGNPPAVWSLTDYPTGFATPAGWTLDSSSGAIKYTGNGDPPAFTASGVPAWGKFIGKLDVLGHQYISKIGFQIYSPSGFRDVANGESNEFQRNWMVDLKANMRTLETAIATIGSGASIRARLVATANLDLAGAETIDGQATANGDIVLATAQTATEENGPYTVAAGAWERAAGATLSEQFPGMIVAVTQGTTYGDTNWQCTTNGPIDLDTDALTFEQVPNRSDKDKVDRIISARDFGALGDGSNDDATAINAAIASLTDGGTIELPAGVYKCMSVITPAPNVILRGVGQRQVNGFATPATTITDGRTNPVTPLITFGPDSGGDPTSRGAGLRDMMVQFPSAGRTAHGVTCDSTSGVSFKNVHFSGATAGSGIPSATTANMALLYLTASEAVSCEDCTFHYGQRQVRIAGTGAGGPYSFVRDWFYDCNEEHVYCDSNGDHDIRFESCGFDPIYRTTVPSTGFDLKANGFEVVNCSFYGVQTKAPTGTWLAIQGTGSVRCNAIHALGIGVTITSGYVEFSNNAVWAYEALAINGGIVHGGGNLYTPCQGIDNSATGTDPLDQKRGVVVNDPYVSPTSIDIGPDSFGHDTAGSSTNVTGATNATPIVITAVGHGLSNRATVTIASVTGNTAANGTWRIKNKTNDTFEIVDPVTDADVAGNGAFGGGGTVTQVWYWWNSYRCGNITSLEGYKRYTSGTIHYDGVVDGSLNLVQLGNLIRLDKVNRQQVSAGTGTTLTHAQCGDTITPENYVGAVTYLLPAIRAGLEYRIQKRPDVVTGGNPSASITITANGTDRIFSRGQKDGVASLVNADTADYNGSVTLRAIYWYDTVAALDKLRWYVVEQYGNWLPSGANVVEKLHGGTSAQVYADATGLNFPNLTATRVLALDASKYATVLAYAEAATVSTLVMRDSSGIGTFVGVTLDGAGQLKFGSLIGVEMNGGYVRTGFDGSVNGFRAYGGGNLRIEANTNGARIYGGASLVFESNGTGIGFFAATCAAKPSITGSLSTVADAPAKAVMTSIIAALVTLGLASDGTT